MSLTQIRLLSYFTNNHTSAASPQRWEEWFDELYEPVSSSIDVIYIHARFQIHSLDQEMSSYFISIYTRVNYECTLATNKTQLSHIQGASVPPSGIQVNFFLAEALQNNRSVFACVSFQLWEIPCGNETRTLDSTAWSQLMRLTRTLNTIKSTKQALMDSECISNPYKNQTLEQNVHASVSIPECNATHWQVGGIAV